MPVNMSVIMLIFSPTVFAVVCVLTAESKMSSTAVEAKAETEVTVDTVPTVTADWSATRLTLKLLVPAISES